MLPAPALRTRVLIFDEPAAHPNVIQPIEHVSLGGVAVAPGPTELLVIGLHAARKIRVEDIPDVRLVDPHAESDGRHDHDAGIGHEDVLVGFTLPGLHARMIGQRAHPIRRQHGSGLLRLLPREAIDDSASAFMARDEAPQLPLPAALHLHRERDIGAVEAEHELLDPAVEQSLDDVPRGSPRRRSPSAQ